MIEFLCGTVVGFWVGVGVMVFDSHRHRVKDRVQQEQEYIEVQGMVDEIVTKLERIIYRRRP